MPRAFNSQRSVSLPSYASVAKYLNYKHYDGFLYDRQHGWPFINYGLNSTSKPGGWALKTAVSPFYYEFGLVPWYVDLNELLERKRHTHLSSLYDLTHVRIFRSPPPGPFFFLPRRDEYYTFIESYLTCYEEKQTRRVQLPFYHRRDLRVPTRCHIDCVVWFDPKNPFITWKPETSCWYLYYRDPVTEQHVSGNFGPWSYHKAVQKLQRFLLRTCGHQVSDLSLELLKHASGFEQFIPKGDVNRALTHLLGKRVALPEHPRDPYWFHAAQARAAQLEELEASRAKRSELDESFMDSLSSLSASSTESLSRYLLGE